MIMKFDTGRFIHREVTWEDLDFIHQLHSMREADEYNTLEIPQNEEETEEVIRPNRDNQKALQRKIYGWVIVEKKVINPLDWRK